MSNIIQSITARTGTNTVRDGRDPEKTILGYGRTPKTGRVKYKDLSVVIKTEVVTLSPRDALGVLAEFKYKLQRRVRDHQVKRYNEEMKKGEWAPGGQIIIAHWHGNTFNLDSNHRLHALALGGVPNITFTITHYFFDDKATMRDIADYYAKIDQGLMRSWRDITTAYELVERKKALNITLVNRMGPAIAHMYFNFGRLSRTHHYLSKVDQVKYTEKFVGMAAKYWEAIDGGEFAADLKQSAYFSLGMITFKYAPDQALDYWSGISYNDGLRNVDPRARIVKLIIDRSRNVTIQDKTLAAARCWNAFVDQQNLSSLYIPTIGDRGYPVKMTPLTIGDVESIRKILDE